MHELQFQIILIKSSIKFTSRQLWHLQGLSASREAVRGCLLQLRRYEHELKVKEAMLAASKA